MPERPVLFDKDGARRVVDAVRKVEGQAVDLTAGGRHRRTHFPTPIRLAQIVSLNSRTGNFGNYTVNEISPDDGSVLRTGLTPVYVEDAGVTFPAGARGLLGRSSDGTLWMRDVSIYAGGAMYQVVKDTFHVDIERDLNVDGVGVGDTAQAHIIPPHRQWYHFGTDAPTAGGTVLLIPSDSTAAQTPAYVPERRTGTIKAIAGAVLCSTAGGGNPPIAAGSIALTVCKAIEADTKDDGVVDNPGWTDCGTTLTLDGSNSTNEKDGLDFDITDLGAVGVKATGSVGLTYAGNYPHVEAWVLLQSPAVLTVPIGPIGSDILQLIVSMANARLKWDSSSVKVYLGYRPLQT